ncbi:MAG: hypothetical protein WBM81_07400, partial [Sedimenticolaceae bacterium]
GVRWTQADMGRKISQFQPAVPVRAQKNDGPLDAGVGFVGLDRVNATGPCIGSWHAATLYRATGPAHPIPADH